MTKKTRTVRITICVLLIGLLVATPMLWKRFSHSKWYHEQVLRSERTAASFQCPSFDGEITDVSVSFVERTYIATSDYEPYNMDTDCIYLQAYYNYIMDGVEYSYPAENYDLISLSGMSRGFDASYLSHLVQIGPYLLVSFDDHSSGSNFRAVDTLGSELRDFLSIYLSENGLDDETTKLGYYAEDYETFDLPSGTFNYFGNPMDKGLYMIIPISQLTDSYHLSYFTKGALVDSCELSGADILRLLNENSP